MFFSKVKFRPTTGTLNLGYVFELLDFLDLISITIYSLNILMIVIKIKLKIQNIFYKALLAELVQLQGRVYILHLFIYLTRNTVGFLKISLQHLNTVPNATRPDTSSTVVLMSY